MKYQAGMTLLEVTIALVIGGAVVLAGVGTYRTYETRSNTNEVRSELRTLMVALEDYYQAYCATTPFPAPTPSSLTSQGWLPAQFDFDNDYGADYSVSISPLSTPPTYTIELQLNPGLSAPFFRQHFNATAAAGQVLYWTYPINLGTQYQNNSHSRFQNFFGTNCQ